jgi:very-short-patch-repair endonuclease
MKAQPNLVHELFAKHLTELGLRFEREVRFHPLRRWLWDFTLPEHRIAIEIQGAIWAGRKGGHTGGKGMQRDMDKRNAGAMLAWCLLTFSTQDISRGRAKAFIAEHILGRKA